MENYIAVAVVALIVFLAVFYIVREKKKGKKCIGCPYGDSCGKKCGCVSKNKNDI